MRLPLFCAVFVALLSGCSGDGVIEVAELEKSGKSFDAVIVSVDIIQEDIQMHSSYRPPNITTLKLDDGKEIKLKIPRGEITDRFSMRGVKIGDRRNFPGLYQKKR